MSSRQAGRVAALITVAYIGVGFPAQIWHLISRWSANDLSIPMVALGTLTFTAWAVTGYLRPRNLALAAPNTVGAVASLALLVTALVVCATQR
jgi:hypothetical protein